MEKKLTFTCDMQVIAREIGEMGTTLEITLRIDGKKFVQQAFAYTILEGEEGEKTIIGIKTLEPFKEGIKVSHEGFMGLTEAYATIFEKAFSDFILQLYSDSY